MPCTTYTLSEFRWVEYRYVSMSKSFFYVKSFFGVVQASQFSDWMPLLTVNQSQRCFISQTGQSHHSCAQYRNGKNFRIPTLASTARLCLRPTHSNCKKFWLHCLKSKVKNPSGPWRKYGPLSTCECRWAKMYLLFTCYCKQCNVFL